MKYDGKPPSRAARSKDYAGLQREPNFAIYDGRYAPEAGTTVAPPIQIFHPVFEGFIRRLEDPTLRPIRDFLVLVQQFMAEASKIRSLERDRAEKYRDMLRQILRFVFHTASNIDKTEADGVISNMKQSGCIS